MELPQVNIIARMASDLALPAQKIYTVARSADRRYRHVLLLRKDRKARTVWQPSPELRLLQRWCLDHIFTKLPVHDQCYSYRKGRNIKMHAEVHARSNFISRIDIRSFFPSLKKESVRHFLASKEELLGLTYGEVDLLVDIVTRRGELAIGAPTSPILSNCIMYEFDLKWGALATADGLLYTRYADDIYVSAKERGIVVPFIERIAIDLRHWPGYNFFINEKKTVHTSRKKLRRVTGIVITPQGGLSIGRGEKRSLRTQIFLAINGKLDQLQLQSLLGLLSFGTSIENGLLARLESKYGPDLKIRIEQAMGGEL